MPDVRTAGDSKERVLMNTPSRHSLPAHPSLEHLRKQAKKRVRDNPPLSLAEAQHQLAREYGFSNWAELSQRVRELARPGKLEDQITEAILRGDVEAVKELLETSPQLLSPALWPPTIFQAKNLEITRLLLDSGLSPDACSAPRKPLHLAVYQCLPDIVEILIAQGADVRLRNPLGETPLDLLDAYEPRPLGDGRVARIRKALVEAGAEEDFYSLIRVGDGEGVRKWLEADPSLARADNELGGPLFVAVRSARVEIVKLLLAHGANPNTVNSMRNTPLWFAAQSAARSEDRIAVMRELLAAGAEINRRCEGGSTALSYAAWRGNLEVVKFLLAEGALNWVEDDEGKLPKDYAESGSAPDKKEIVKLLSGLQITDANFRAAVRAMEEGDLEAFRKLIREYPNLATDRVPEEAWDQGNYFHRPTLLHFIAENPWRTKKVPANICAIAQVLLEAGADINAETAAIENPHTTLDLVVSSLPARTSGQQEKMIDFLLAHGAKSDRAIEVALTNDEPRAAESLRAKGAKVTLVAAAGLGLSEELQSLLTETPPTETVCERALSVALKYRQWETAEILLNRGVDLDKEIVHAGTPLHHAALANFREGCEKLLARGARLDIKDRLWNGTPADWAWHGGGYAELAEWLRGEAKSFPSEADA